MRIFISHSSTDAQTANEICRMLEAESHSCFIAPRDIRSGHSYAEELVDGIDGADIMLLLLSQKANESPHVLREIERAVSKRKPIIVCKLEDVTPSKALEYFLMTHQWLDIQAGNNLKDILHCVNEFAAEPVSDTGKSEESRGNSLGTAIFLIAVGVILLTAMVVIYLVGQNSAGEDNSDFGESFFNSAAMSSDYQYDESSAADGYSQGENSVNADSSLESSTEAPITAFSPELGSTFVMGTYNGQPIKWRVIKISDDEKSAVIISDDIITIKAFDAAESGKYNYIDGKSYWGVSNGELSAEQQRLLRGDNRWELSNIRTWLNSDKEMVQYSDTAPVSTAMSELANGYNTEAGFLKSFSAEELSVIKETKLLTNGTETIDRVFLLSSDEVEWLYEADVSIYAEPTPEAMEQDKSEWYDVNCQMVNVTDHFWWLRDADDENACNAHIVNLSFAQERITTEAVGLEGYGIRPVMTIDLTAEKLLQLFVGE